MITKNIVNHEIKWILVPLTALVLACALTSAGVGAQNAAMPSQPGRIEPAADDLLHKMSDALAGAKQFTVKGERTVDPALLHGGMVNTTARFEIAVQRPSGIQARTAGAEGTRSFFFDGKQISLLDENMNLYASVAAPGTNDEMLDTLNEKYGFTPPLVDFLVQDPYGNLTRNVLSGTDQGLETINGTECHHLNCKQENLQWEVWIATSDLLPRKFVLYDKDKPGAPQLQAVFTQWDLAPHLNAGTFAFTPPPGADRIEMVPITNPNGATAGEAAPARPERK